MKNMEIACLLRQARESLKWDFRNSVWCLTEIFRVYVLKWDRR